MAYMLVMATGKLGDPVAGIVLLKVGYFLLHEFNAPLEQREASVPSDE